MAAKDRPNIVVILTDEERERVWFAEHVRLPHRERLATQGMRFANHHVHTLPCTPSRATILTGRHAASTGMFDNTNFKWQAPLAPTIPTLGTMLSAAGYRCLYRENAQVPLTMAWPNMIPAGQSPERLSGAIDLVPTLLSVAEAGVVSAPVHRGFLRGIVTEKHKYGRYFRPGEQGLGRTAADLELYDRTQDPTEMRNLAHPDMVDSTANSLIEDLDSRLDDLIRAEIGRDDVDLPEPKRRLAFLGPLWRRRARADHLPILPGPGN